MRYKVLAFAILASVMFMPSLLAAGEERDCCNDKACAMACCKHEGDAAAAAALLPASTPVRQVAVVWFKNPVLVGESILMGKYIIEHDNDRMAKGLPCTHIYAADKPLVPVVKFHCVHLDSERTDRDMVTLLPTGDPTLLKKFASFQFAGESAAHGYPK